MMMPATMPVWLRQPSVAAKREAKWREAGYTVISMKNDFKTIYGPEVQKVDFVFPE